MKITDDTPLNPKLIIESPYADALLRVLAAARDLIAAEYPGLLRPNAPLCVAVREFDALIQRSGSPMKRKSHKKKKKGSRQLREPQPFACPPASSRDLPDDLVSCPECGHQQADMGNGVVCEACNFGPMPTTG